MRFRLLSRQLALGLLSVSLIALQLALMQSFSISQWHHFAYLVISIALLGFGAAGTLLALGRAWILQRSKALLPLLLFGCALAIAFAAGRVQLLFLSFDSYLLPYDPTQAVLLLAIILLLSLPFTLGALVIGILFIEQAEQIGIMYFANLIGSGLGGLVGIATLTRFAPEQLTPALALPALTAGLLLLPRVKRLQIAAVLTLAALAFALAYPPALPLSQFKDLQKTLDLPGSDTVAIRNDPYGQVRAVSSPALRFAPGLSLNYRGPVPLGDVLFSNGDWFGFVPTGSFSEAASLLDFTIQGLPFAIRSPNTVLVLYSGTGLAAAQALNHRATSVIAVEPHQAALDLLRDSYPQTAGAFYALPQLQLEATEPRTWLATDARSYDLILLPTLGAFGGTAGVFALHEQHSLTREAFTQIWQHLNADGMLCLSAWMDYPPRAPLRIAATLAELLEAEDIKAPLDHLTAARSWGAVSFCLKRSPLTTNEIGSIRQFCNDKGFDPLLLPDLTTVERERFHQLQDHAFFDLLDHLLTEERQQTYHSYLFNLRPTTDDRPFFSQFLRWKTLPHLATLFGHQTLPAMELGTLMVIATFLLTSAAAIVLILLPLLRLGWSTGKRASVIGYFGSLGLGYMLVEVSLIHRFVLFLGHPIQAAATVICALLVGSGFGSACTGRLPSHLAVPQHTTAAVTLLLALYTLILPPMLQWAIPLSPGWRMALALFLLTPAGVIMGLPFPLGLLKLNRNQPATVPWAWGINGCLSVIGTSLATIIAIQAGFNAVMLTAAAAYGCATISGHRLFTSNLPKN